MKKLAFCLALFSFTVASQLDKGHAQAVPRTAVHFWEEGNEHFKEDRLDDAVQSYSKAIEADASFAKAYSSRGGVLYKMERYAAAISDYDRAIDLEPRNAVTYHNRGWVHASDGQTDKAIADFSKAIELNDPDLDDAYLMRSRL